MNQGEHHIAPPLEVLDDVAKATGGNVRLLGRLSGGINSGATRVHLAGGEHAVLKAEPLTRPNQLNEALTAQRVVEHMRVQGYPTPAWLELGATATHVWHLMELVDAAPVTGLTPEIVAQLMNIVELQAGQSTETYDHWSYAWRVATGRKLSEAEQERDETFEHLFLRQSIAELSRYSPKVLRLVERLRRLCVDVPPPSELPDMVHADLNPGNILVRDRAVVAVVDIGNAGSGTRATDLITLQWHTFEDHLDGARRNLWTRILGIIGWEGASVLLASHILHMLEWPIRLGRHDLGVVERGHRALDELIALR